MNPEILDLQSIETRHPKLSLLHSFGCEAAIRLSENATESEMISQQAMIPVDWVSKESYPEASEVRRTVNWKSVAEMRAIEIAKIPFTKNEQQITSEAAIAIVSLMIHALAGIEIVGVLKIGSGSDYKIQLQSAESVLECSGLNRPGGRSRSRDRLREKREQLLGKDDHGYVGIVTFGGVEFGGTRCDLHFVKKPLG
jgi:hypothetical protein